MRPGVSFELTNGNIGAAPATEDGVAGFVLSCEDVDLEGIPFQFFSIADVEALGIRSGNDGSAHSHWVLNNFFSTAGEGSECWVILFPTSSHAFEEYAKIGSGTAERLLDVAGNIRLLGISREETAPFVYNGNRLPDEVINAMTYAQALAVSYGDKIKPIRVIIDGYGMDPETINPVQDMRSYSNNRCSVVIVTTKPDHYQADIGLTVGMLAALPVHRKLHRVKNGSLPITNAYFTSGTPVIDEMSRWDDYYNKGLVFIGTHPNRSGYYFIDDPTAVRITDDYASISRGRIIDKAMIVANSVVQEEIGDEIDTNANGTPKSGEVKEIQGQIQNALLLAMRGEIEDALAFISITQNVGSTGQLYVELDIYAVGYTDVISFRLGYRIEQ